MYLFIFFALAAFGFAAMGMVRLVAGVSGRNTGKILDSAYWLLAAVVTMVAGLGFLLAE